MRQVYFFWREMSDPACSARDTKLLWSIRVVWEMITTHLPRGWRCQENVWDPRTGAAAHRVLVWLLQRPRVAPAVPLWGFGDTALSFFPWAGIAFTGGLTGAEEGSIFWKLCETSSPHQALFSPPLEFCRRKLTFNVNQLALIAASVLH